jgi:hypothetical protein
MAFSYENRTVNLSCAYKKIAKGESILPCFPDDMSEPLSGAKDLAIIEVADRDSIAAAMKAIKEGIVTEILPVADIIPPESGNINKAFSQIFWLKHETQKYDVKFYDLVFITYDDLYNVLTARYSEELITKYGFYSPCLTCHLYFHASRAPLVQALGGTKIIGGERNSHNGKIKMSQLPMALDYYKKAISDLGAELILPIRDISDTKDIINLSYHDNAQLSCMFKQMYGKIPTRIIQNEALMKNFFERFAVPLSVGLIKELTTNPDADIIAFSDAFMQNLVDESQ